MDAPASQLSAFAGEGGRGFRSGQARSAFATAAGVRALAPAVLRDGGWPGPWDGGGGGSEGEADDMARDRPRFRAIFISDLHLGTPGCQAGALLDFLREQESETLYLVGDIVDGWQLRRQWYWPQA
ncbi:MAG TPA: hypothetical protein PK510_14305, partial [Ottowia sp.]|nr:hypothetical protein [Ottowia sp.]